MQLAELKKEIDVALAHLLLASPHHCFSIRDGYDTLLQRWHTCACGDIGNGTAAVVSLLSEW
jgi:hypothetical protein